MPLTIPAGTGVASFRMTYGADPEPMYCTLGVQPIVAPLALLHAQRLRDAWRADILDMQVDDIIFNGVTLRVRQDDGSDLVYDSDPITTAAGATIGNGFPGNTAYLIEKLTTLGGKRGLGRMFVPGVPDDQVNDIGTVNAATQTAIATILQSFYNGLTGAADATYTGLAVRPVLLHSNTTVTTRSSTATSRTKTVTQGAAGPAPTVITGFRLDPRVATQRRRLR